MTIQLPGQVYVAPSADELYDELAMTLMATSLKQVRAAGCFHLALSGGTTPQPFYMRLVIDPRFRPIPWQRIHLWQVDERVVPVDDPRSNFGMIRELLADHIPTPSSQIHPMSVAHPQGDGQYQDQLASALGPDGRLDFVLLGMGADGHTASLFADSEALGESSRWVRVHETVQGARMTMTLPLLNRARQIAVLVTGQAKSETVGRLARWTAAGSLDPRPLPMAQVDPDDGQLDWYLDPDAARCRGSTGQTSSSGARPV